MPAHRCVILAKVQIIQLHPSWQPTADSIAGGLRHIWAVSSGLLGAGREFGDSIDRDVRQAQGVPRQDSRGLWTFSRRQDSTNQGLMRDPTAYIKKLRGFQSPSHHKITALKYGDYQVHCPDAYGAKAKRSSSRFDPLSVSSTAPPARKDAAG